MIEEVIRFVSGSVELEGLLTYEDDLKESYGLAWVLSPHPFLGGDMNNNVVKALTRSLAETHRVVLRFNYRGMGESQCDIDLKQSQKEFWEDSTCPEYEQKIYEDCTAAYTYLSKAFKEVQRRDVVGYSFGCLPALALADEHHDIERVCLVSPPVAKWTLPPKHLNLSQSKYIYYAPGDFACPEEILENVFANMTEPKKLYKIDANDHFFIGHETKLTCRLVESLKT